MALHCPYCQNGVEEETVRCEVCGLCMDSADDAFGVPPPITAGICDRRRRLSASGERRLRRTLAEFRAEFPQVEPTVMIHPINAAHPLKPWTFWFFNRSGLGAALSTGAANRHVLLVIDSENLRAAITVGYGLEPFLSPQRLTEILADVAEPLAEQDFEEAAVRFVLVLEERLRAIVDGLPRAFGLLETEIAPAAGGPRKSSEGGNW